MFERVLRIEYMHNMRLVGNTHILNIVHFDIVILSIEHILDLQIPHLVFVQLRTWIVEALQARLIHVVLNLNVATRLTAMHYHALQRVGYIDGELHWIGRRSSPLLLADISVVVVAAVDIVGVADALCGGVIAAVHFVDVLLVLAVSLLLFWRFAILTRSVLVQIHCVASRQFVWRRVQRIQLIVVVVEGGGEPTDSLLVFHVD
mmetsp:Transcript_6602/g.10833  ORF Transcript_6602/g.10833 Transcript_6602/m.10833 type:complete len:204 (+) Transcript_6602:318-929(+)